jgi:hypothetical protein
MTLRAAFLHRQKILHFGAVPVARTQSYDSVEASCNVSGVAASRPSSRPIANQK